MSKLGVGKLTLAVVVIKVKTWVFERHQALTACPIQPAYECRSSFQQLLQTGFMNDIHFYRNLPPVTPDVADVLQDAFFYAVPPGWFVVMADVKNSSAAIHAGLHREVNLVAAAALIAVLNIARKYKLEFPFFFGGDGGTALVPALMVTEVLAALQLHNENSRNNFDLEMHVGCMPLQEVYRHGHFLKVARLQVDDYFQKPMVVGDGLRYAEQQIKDAAGDPSKHAPAVLDLQGLECRWDTIKPPAEEQEVVCYLIESLHPGEQIEVYREVLLKIKEIYGDETRRHPLSPDRLRLLVSLASIKNETVVKYGSWKKTYFLSVFLKNWIGRLLFAYNWKLQDIKAWDYLHQLIAHSDILTIDGRINTMMAGSMENRINFNHYLSGREKEGKLIYGHHINRQSMITCYIESRQLRHLHFVDGADGGYTEAARELKAKWRQLHLLK